MPETGRIITRFGSESLLESSQGDIIRCTTRRKLEHIACGDWVEWQSNEQGNATILKLLPRKNALARPDFRGKMKTIATNIDLLLIVISWRPAPAWEMLDRYLIAASMLPTEAIIVVNKHDLQQKYATPEALAALQEYQQIGYNIIYTEALEGSGIETLRHAIQQKTAVLAGQSGVGKSSLAIQLIPDIEIKTGAIAATGEGRHTTTNAMLYHLPDGGELIDSPGVRDFSLPSITTVNLQDAYPEIQKYQGYCRFNNCTHQHEPSCAVKQALQNEEIPPLRYQRYLNILASSDKV